MILDCPACDARYRLPDDAIPPAGKTVRCARCKHSWIELGQVLDDGLARDTRAPATAAADTAFLEAIATREPLGPIAGSPPINAAPAMSAVEVSAAAEPNPERPRRRRWLWLFPLLLLIALLLGAAAVLTRIVALPAPLASRLDLTVLALPAVELPPLDLTRIPYAGQWLDHRLNPPALPPVPLILQANAEFHELSNGSRMLALTGSVANPTSSQQTVPEIEALVLDASRQPVYRWRIPAPLVALPPRSSSPFDSSASGYPATGVGVTLRFVREP